MGCNRMSKNTSLAVLPAAEAVWAMANLQYNKGRYNANACCIFLKHPLWVANCNLSLMCSYIKMFMK